MCVMCLWYSNHMTLNIEPAVAVILAVFTAVMGVVVDVSRVSVV